MANAIDEFLKHLTASQLMTADDSDAFLKRFPEIRKAGDGETFARVLIREEKLTSFQATSILKGKPKGLILGEYALLDRIGSGGMGHVFKAIHQRMERVVALKVLPLKMTSLPEAVQRFHREVKAGAKLSHPNIVTVYDAGEAIGVYYLVMEYVEGSDLSKLVAKEGGLQVDTAVNYILQAAEGLKHAHAQGVIHRDIKPANLLIDKNGIVKVLDMGLAQLQQETLKAARQMPAAVKPGDSGSLKPGDSGPLKVGLTQAGSVLGTIHYMAPEQAVDPRHADQLSDIYSLGCTLHYVLTGQPLYTGDTLDEQIAAHRDTALPSLRAARPEVSVPIDAIFQKMVAKKPEDRYQSMSEVMAALKSCGGSPKPAPPQKKDDAIPEFVIKAIFDD